MIYNGVYCDDYPDPLVSRLTIVRRVNGLCLIIICSVQCNNSILTLDM